MIRSPLFRSSPFLAALAVLAAACAIDRPREQESGIHPAGFADKDSASFHGTYLHGEYQKNKRYPLGECRKCHGDDYGGGAVGTSCNQAGCHTQGVEYCGTCHDGNAPPKPTSGSHAAHKLDCTSCHDLPKNASEAQHPDGQVEVYLTGLAANGGLSAQWDPVERRCTNTYCHGGDNPKGGKSPVWESPQAPLPCDSCHGAPPPTHARFQVGKPPEGCTPCHPGHDSPEHLNGKIDYLEPTCTTCHGKDKTGAPPPALDGSTSPSSRGVGAHKRHLDPTLLDRMGKPVACQTCHDVPASMLAEGHIDVSAPADVRLFGGSYDVKTGSCVIGCHWDKTPGPAWTDDSGAARACDACHGFPPEKTRAGIPHPQVAANVDVCRTCHLFEATTHVDGHVDFLP